MKPGRELLATLGTWLNDRLGLDAIEKLAKKKEIPVIHLDLCQKCGICRIECKFDAIQVN